MGRAQEKRMLRAEHPIKWQMVGRSRLRAWQENSRRHERLDYHNRAR